MATKNKKIGELLIELGAITEDQLEEALKVSKSKGDVLGETLLDLGFLDEKTLCKGLEYIYHLPYVDLSNVVVDKDACSMINEAIAKKNNLIPIKKEGNVLSVVMFDPLNFYAIDDVKNSSGMQVSVSGISTKRSISSSIDRY